MTEIAAMFSGAPRFTVNRQPEAGTTSASAIPPRLSRKVLSFAEECIGASPSKTKQQRGRGLKVGFIGLGSQGAPMARRIIEGGYPTTLWRADPGPWRRSPAPRQASRITGRTRRRQRPGVPVCRGDADIDELIGGEHGVLAGLEPGGVIAVHSTVHPNTCRELADRQEPRAFRSSMRGERRWTGRGGGSPAVMAGGDADVVDRCRPVFETYADPVIHLGELGSGQTTKLLNNLLFTPTWDRRPAPFRCEVPRVSPDRLAEVVSRSSGNSFALTPSAELVAWKTLPACGNAAAEGCPAGRRPGRHSRDSRRAVLDSADATLNLMGIPMRVGFIGAGRMGPPLWPASCRRPRRPSPRERPRIGATRTVRCDARARCGRGRAQADVVVLCVFTDAQLRQVCLDSACCQPCRLVRHCWYTPPQARTRRDHRGASRRHGVDIVDAPVSGGPHDIAAGKLTLFVGGATTPWRAAAVLDCYGDPFCTSGHWRGQKVKLVNNALSRACRAARRVRPLGDGLVSRSPTLLAR